MRLIWDAEGKKYGTHDPTPELIEELIEDLDNEQRTMVALDVQGQCCLMVIGGHDGRVRVNFIPEDLNVASQHLIDPDTGGETVQLRMQGKLATYHIEHTVPKEIAIYALSEFVRSASLSADLYWQPD